MFNGRIDKARMRAVTITCLIGLLCSCGDSTVNGGGIGGTGKTTITEDDGLILGKVTGFGSIVINDQRFDTENAQFIVDGKNAKITDIQVGMNISASVNFNLLSASRVFYQPLVTGPVHIDETEDTRSMVSILGQTIVITPETILDGLTIDSLQPDLIIEISGTRDSNQSIVADYIAVAAENTPYYTVGVINRVNQEDSTAELSGTTINYLPVVTDAENQTETAARLKPGNVVRVEVAHALPAPIALPLTLPTTLEKTHDELLIADVQTIDQFNYTRGSRVEITGRVNTSSSDGAFIVRGVTVYTDVTTKVYSRFGILIENPVLRNNEAVILNGTALGKRRITAQSITLNDRL